MKVIVYKTNAFIHTIESPFIKILIERRRSFIHTFFSTFSFSLFNMIIIYRLQLLLSIIAYVILSLTTPIVNTFEYGINTLLGFCFVIYFLFL